MPRAAADATIFYYHGCNWTDLPARQRYLMEAISQFVPVVFFDGDGDRRFGTTIRRVATNVTVVRGLMSTCLRLRRKGFGVLASAYARWRLAEIRAEHSKVIFWCAENWLRPYRFIRHDALIYDCIDPCFDPARRTIFDQRENSVARAASLVFASADSLLEKMLKVNPNSYLLPNACSESDYDPSELASLPRPQPLRGRAGPIIGYMGSFDWRVDTAMIAETARLLPEFTFALVGRVNPDQQDRVRPLRDLPNVVLPGTVSVQDGRAYVAAFDVGIVPFLPGEIGDAINPVKMYMYLLAGKPVVSTWLRECRRLSPWVAATRTAHEMAAEIRSAAAAPPSAAAERTAFARGHTWNVRAREALTILSERGLTPMPATAEALA